MTMLTAARPVKQTHFPELDGIRGLAILSVMSLHFFASQIHGPQNSTEKLAYAITGYGMWGVDLFFVLSGYLITGLLSDTRDSTKYFSSFYMRRTLRIFPLYYGVLFVLIVLIPRSFLEAHAPDALQIREVQPWLWSYLTNVYIAKVNSYSIPYVSHFWTLAIEEHFYLFWPLVVRFASRRTAIVVAVALSVLALGARIVLALTVKSDDLDLWAHVFTPCRLDSLCIGAAFALWVRGPEGWAVLRRAAIGAPFVVATMLALRLVPNQGPMHQIAVEIKEFLLAVLFAIFVSTSVWPSGWKFMRSSLRVRALMLLGKYSYGLYVFHWIIAYYFDLHDGITRFARIAGSRAGGLFLQALVGVVLSMIVAVVSYHVYEMPFLRLKRLFKA
jgi:peptidoglycan/LPS O-acetylase OafA/YrhL